MGWPLLRREDPKTVSMPGAQAEQRGVEGGGRGDTDRPGCASNPAAEAPATASAPRSAALFIGIPSRNPSRNFCVLLG